MEQNNANNIFISLIVPAYNEEVVLDAFCERTIPILTAIDDRFEIIFVNDGSDDDTSDKIRALNKKDKRIKLIDLSRNFGKEIAMTAGIDFAQGEIVVITDADLQDPPEIIPDMVKKWREGFDTVYATRIVRDGETALKKATAKAFYKVIGKMSRVEIPANTGDFRLINRRTVNALRMLRENHRFMKGLFSWVGFKQTSIHYYREPRYAGKTKWNYWRLWNFAIEGITSFSFAPLQLASYIGIVVSIGSFLYAMLLIVRTMAFGKDVPGYASIMVTILFLGGIQTLFIGIIGEYLGRMFNETKSRPLYLIQDLTGIEIEQNPSINGRGGICL